MEDARRKRGGPWALMARVLVAGLLLGLLAVFPGVSSLGEAERFFVWLSPAPAFAREAEGVDAAGPGGEAWLKGLESRVLALLTPIYGEGHVVVQASFGGGAAAGGRPPVSVAIVVDTAVVGLTPGSPEAIRAEEERLSSLVGHAAGLGRARGDAIAVNFLLFSGSRGLGAWQIACGAGAALLLGLLLFLKFAKGGGGQASDGEPAPAARKMTEPSRRRAPKELASRLKGERPQARAVALALLEAGEAARTLAALPQALRAETAACMALQGRVGPEVLELVRRDLLGGLEEEGGSVFDGGLDPAEGTARVLRRMEQGARESLLSELRRASPRAWRRLSPLLED